MRDFEKYIKAINKICLENRTSSISVLELGHNENEIRTREVLAYLQAKEYIKLFYADNHVFIERLPASIAYFEDKKSSSIATLKNWSMNATIAIISALAGALLARLSFVLFP